MRSHHDAILQLPYKPRDELLHDCIYRDHSRIPLSLKSRSEKVMWVFLEHGSLGIRRRGNGISTPLRSVYGGRWCGATGRWCTSRVWQKLQHQASKQPFWIWGNTSQTLSQPVKAKSPLYSYSSLHISWSADLHRPSFCLWDCHQLRRFLTPLSAPRSPGRRNSTTSQTSRKLTVGRWIVQLTSECVR